MASIAKCTDRKCPSRKTCWRYVVPSSRPQAYTDFNRPDGADKCEAYEHCGRDWKTLEVTK